MSYLDNGNKLHYDVAKRYFQEDLFEPPEKNIGWVIFQVYADSSDNRITKEQVLITDDTNPM